MKRMNYHIHRKKNIKKFPQKYCQHAILVVEMSSADPLPYGCCRPVSLFAYFLCCQPAIFIELIGLLWARLWMLQKIAIYDCKILPIPTQVYIVLQRHPKYSSTGPIHQGYRLKLVPTRPSRPPSLVYLFPRWHGIKMANLSPQRKLKLIPANTTLPSHLKTLMSMALVVIELLWKMIRDQALPMSM